MRPAQSLRKEGETYLNDDLEAKLRFIWKLYFVALISEELRERNLKNESIDRVVAEVERANLIPKEKSLRNVLRSVVGFFRNHHLKDASVEIPGFAARISFVEPDAEGLEKGLKTPQDLLQMLQDGLEEVRYTIWVTLDRLDVAFASAADPALEQSALRALFRVYLDMSGMSQVRLKIFLREDIWKKIMNSPFREASHIERYTTLKWDKANLLYLLCKRILSNAELRNDFLDHKKPEQILDDPKEQESLFYRIFPKKIDRQQTINWIFSRIEDGNKVITPRELIHLLEESRVQQILLNEIGTQKGKGDGLISTKAVKAAFVEVSKFRLTQTILAETSLLRERIEELKEGKTEHCISSLIDIWQDLDQEEVTEVAEGLVEIGFFQKRKKHNQIRYWIPFIYRPALQLTQGSDCKDD